MKKEALIERIVEYLKNNTFEYEDYIFDLVREALETRTVEELEEIQI